MIYADNLGSDFGNIAVIWDGGLAACATTINGAPQGWSDNGPSDFNPAAGGQAYQTTMGGAADRVVVVTCTPAFQQACNVAAVAVAGAVGSAFIRGEAKCASQTWQASCVLPSTGSCSETASGLDVTPYRCVLVANGASYEATVTCNWNAAAPCPPEEVGAVPVCVDLPPIPEELRQLPVDQMVDDPDDYLDPNYNYLPAPFGPEKDIPAVTQPVDVFAPGFGHNQRMITDMWVHPLRAINANQPNHQDGCHIPDITDAAIVIEELFYIRVHIEPCGTFDASGSDSWTRCNDYANAHVVEDHVYVCSVTNYQDNGASLSGWVDANGNPHLGTFAVIAENCTASNGGKCKDWGPEDLIYQHELSHIIGADEHPANDWRKYYCSQGTGIMNYCQADIHDARYYARKSAQQICAVIDTCVVVN